MSEDICPVKEERRKKFPTRRVNLYHEWKWQRLGKDGNGADIRKAQCDLCGYELAATRFCRRCGLRLVRWGTRDGLCNFCVEDRVEVMA